MRNACRAVVLALLFASSFFIMGVVPGADLPEYIKKQSHSEKECGVKVIRDSNADDVLRLEDGGGSTRILVVQISPEKFKDEYGPVIIKWASETGNTVWFYDSRLASHFGMERRDINPDGAMSKDVTGELGGRKCPGKAVVVTAFGRHPVLSGVGGAVVFIPKTGEDSFSAVKCGGGVTALLKYDLASDEAVSAIREVGKGRIILKPLLWPDQLDGLRFQTNIMEYSAGFPVPVITTKDSPVTDEMMVPSKHSDDWEEIDVIELSDGRTVWGKIGNREFVFEGISKGKRMKRDEISSIIFSEKGSGLDVVELRPSVDGKAARREKGLLSVGIDGISFKTPSGKVVKIGKKEIRKIIFNSPKEKDK